MKLPYFTYSGQDFISMKSDKPIICPVANALVVEMCRTGDTSVIFTEWNGIECYAVVPSADLTPFALPDGTSHGEYRPREVFAEKVKRLIAR